MSNQIERKKIEFNTLITIMIEKGTFEEIPFLLKIISEFKDNYTDFCDILEDHLINDDNNYRINLFPILDSIFKSEVGKLYIDKIDNQNLTDAFEACFEVTIKEKKILLFKIFYTWKYLIPNKVYEAIRADLRLDEFKKVVEKELPGTIAKYKEYRKKFKTDKKKIKPTNNGKNDLNKINNKDKDKIPLIEPEKDKPKKVLKKKRKLLSKEQENENIPNKKTVLENHIPNLIGNSLTAPTNANNIFIDPAKLFFGASFSKNEFKLFNFLINNSVTLNKNLPFFSSMAKYYNEALLINKYPDSLSNFKLINNNEQEYQNIRRRMKEKLFLETNKNNCAICGFRTLFYNDLIRHLDIHFNFNYLEMEGKNIYRKNGNNKNSWINGDGGKNLKKKNSEMGVETAKNGTLEILVFYKNMMNNNLIQVNNEKKEDNEELMIPINDESEKICHYCGDNFKKIFSIKYNSWFYNKVVVVLDEKVKYLAHQACFEELDKKIK